MNAIDTFWMRYMGWTASYQFGAHSIDWVCMIVVVTFIVLVNKKVKV